MRATSVISDLPPVQMSTEMVMEAVEVPPPTLLAVIW